MMIGNIYVYHVWVRDNSCERVSTIKKVWFFFFYEERRLQGYRQLDFAYLSRREKKKEEKNVEAIVIRRFYLLKVKLL